MVNIACIVNNGCEILVLKDHIGRNSFILPEFSAETREYAMHEIKETINADHVYFDFGKDIFCSTEENGDQNVIIMCSAYKWGNLNNSQYYMWVGISKVSPGFLFSENKVICEKIRAFFRRRNNIILQVKETISNLHDQKKVRIEIDDKIDTLSFWLRTSSMAVPFFFTVEYSLEGNNTVLYNTRWRMCRQTADGDTSDLYLLFSETMSLLLKLLNEDVFVSAYNYSDLEPEINAAELFVEGSPVCDEIHEDDFANTIIDCFEVFNCILGAHGYFFGSISNRLTNKKNNEICDFLGPNLNYVVREESSCYYNNHTGCIILDNGQTRFDELLSHYSFEVLTGVTGSLLFSQNSNHILQTNYIPNAVLERVRLVIDHFHVDKYALVSQGNRLYLIANGVVWFFVGDFHHSKTNEEKRLLLERQERENALLLVNRRFQWRYPVNASRFENLIAELIEFQKPDAKVRLVGKTNNADGGKDIVILQTFNGERKLTIVQCKAYERSVNKSNVTDIRDTLDLYDATGYHLAVTSNLTSTLIDHLIDIGKRYDVDWWTEREIFSILRRYPILVDKYNDIINVVN